MEETSLTDFQDATPNDEASLDEETPSAESETTAAFVPAGAACEWCGDAATRLWLDDGARVCSACKSW